MQPTEHLRPFYPAIFLLFLCLTFARNAPAQETRLLRQPTLSERHIAFVYGGDLWVAGRDGGTAWRLTSTPAVESHPHFSPDGRWIAFTSNRMGTDAVYVVSIEGGLPQRLTWYPAPTSVRGWTPDGERILYASTRATARSEPDRPSKAVNSSP